jgi:mutator protein MutT
MDRTIDIYKAAGVLLKDRRFLITRSRGKDFFIAPGGKLEPGESVADALKRELKEELQIEVESAKELGTFYALAAGHDDKYLQMDVLIVEKWSGEISPAAEVEEVMWVNSELPVIKLGSIFQHDVLPKLKSLDLID